MSILIPVPAVKSIRLTRAASLNDFQAYMGERILAVTEYILVRTNILRDYNLNSIGGKSFPVPALSGVATSEGSSFSDSRAKVDFLFAPSV